MRLHLPSVVYYQIGLLLFYKILIAYNSYTIYLYLYLKGKRFPSPPPRRFTCLLQATITFVLLLGQHPDRWNLRIKCEPAAARRPNVHSPQSRCRHRKLLNRVYCLNKNRSFCFVFNIWSFTVGAYRFIPTNWPYFRYFVSTLQRETFRVQPDDTPMIQGLIDSDSD